MKLVNHVIIVILKSELTCKLIKRIPGSHLLISSLPNSDLNRHFELLDKPRDSTSILKALPGKLDIKRHSPIILFIRVRHNQKGKLLKENISMLYFMSFVCFIMWAATQETLTLLHANYKGTDQVAHPQSHQHLCYSLLAK